MSLLMPALTMHFTFFVAVDGVHVAADAAALDWKFPIPSHSPTHPHTDT